MAYGHCDSKVKSDISALSDGGAASNASAPGSSSTLLVVVAVCAVVAAILVLVVVRHRRRFKVDAMRTHPDRFGSTMPADAQDVAVDMSGMAVAQPLATSDMSESEVNVSVPIETSLSITVLESQDGSEAQVDDTDATESSGMLYKDPVELVCEDDGDDAVRQVDMELSASMEWAHRGVVHGGALLLGQHSQSLWMQSLPERDGNAISKARW